VRTTAAMALSCFRVTGAIQDNLTAAQFF
jgi:hypothetical protein